MRIFEDLKFNSLILEPLKKLMFLIIFCLKITNIKNLSFYAKVKTFDNFINWKEKIEAKSVHFERFMFLRQKIEF